MPHFRPPVVLRSAHRTLRTSAHLSASTSTPSSSSTNSTPPLPGSQPSSSAPSKSTKGRSTVDITLIGVAGALVAGGLLWKQQSSTSRPVDSTADDSDRATFTVPVVNQTGTQSMKTLTLLTQNEVNSRLKEHEASYSVARKNNPVFRYDSASLASNSPIEDDSCCVILERDPGSKIKGDLMFWGVFDGHSGWQTSKLLSSTLVSYVARELDLVFRSSPSYASLLSPSSPTKPSPSFLSLFSSTPNTSSSPLELDSSELIVQTAIKNAFKNLDSTIVNAPIKLWEKLQSQGGKMARGGEEVTKEQTEAINTLLPALSGSCALLAFLDAGRNKLHVACTGDSRAVMGIWEPSSSGTGGKWRAEVLSEDQTGRNDKEIKRMRAEHPADEADTVIARGRVLGGLEPTRAFGDARYKWAIGMQEKLAEAFHPGQIRGRPRHYNTPPYVTAEPEVVTVDITSGGSKRQRSMSSLLPVLSSNEPPAPSASRFIVLATDGLYDRLNNDEIVALVGSHLSGLRGEQSRSSIMSSVSSTPSTSTSYNHHVPRQEPQRGEGNIFTFEDTNLSTHLIRNALGGAKREQVSALLSIPAPLSRRYRDDITVVVIQLGNEEGRGGEGGAGGVWRRDEKDLKAKL